jgi:hypothetical protein
MLLIKPISEMAVKKFVAFKGEYVPVTVVPLGPLELNPGGNRLDIPFSYRAAGLYFLQYVDEY